MTILLILVSSWYNILKFRTTNVIPFPSVVQPG